MPRLSLALRRVCVLALLLLGLSALPAHAVLIGKASISGQVRNLIGQSRTLEFRQVREGEAIYYLAQFDFDSREVLTFQLSVQTPGGVAHSLNFNQEMFPEE